MKEKKFILDRDTVYENLSNDFNKSVFRDFESYLRTKKFQKKVINEFRKNIIIDLLILKDPRQIMKS